MPDEAIPMTGPAEAPPSPPEQPPAAPPSSAGAGAGAVAAPVAPPIPVVEAARPTVLGGYGLSAAKVKELFADNAPVQAELLSRIAAAQAAPPQLTREAKRLNDARIAAAAAAGKEPANLYAPAAPIEVIPADAPCDGCP